MPADDPPSSLGSLLAGATAATVVDSIIFPLDTIKTRSQAPGGLLKNGSYKGLYRGIGSVIVCTVPSASIFFFSYEKFKELAKQKGGVDGWKGHLGASALAETISCAVLAPAEIVKQRAQVNAELSTNQVFKALLSSRDWRGLWQGYVGLLGRNVPVTAIQFMLYENFKSRYRLSKVSSSATLTTTTTTTTKRERKEGERIKLSAIESGLCAAGSGSIAAGVTTPMDVLKTRIMLQSSSSSSSSSSASSKSKQETQKEFDRTHKSMIQLGKQVLREEGVRGLFRGLGLRVVWTSMGLSLYLGSYEAMKNYIDG